jgi:hypothetical protein
MQLRILAFTFAVLLSAPFAFAGTLAPGGGPTTGVLDANSNVGTTLATTLAGEDVTADVQKVESRFSNLPTGATTSKMSSDTAIKNAPGFLKRMTCWSDAVATAGNIKLLDNTVAGAGNALLDFDVLAVAYLPFTIEFDVPFSVGLYFDVTTTADLFCQVSYR